MIEKTTFERDEVVYVPFRNTIIEGGKYSKKGYKQAYIIKELEDGKYLVGINTSQTDERYKEFQSEQIYTSEKAEQLCKIGEIEYM